MKHYIDNSEKVFAFESDGSQDHLIKPDMQPITPAEIAERNKPTKEQIAAQSRRERDEALKASDIDVLRYVEQGSPVPDNLKQYRKTLRDMPDQASFPDHVTLPTKPPFKL